ncbi:MAG TPA: holo-ACP synthase [Bacteroidia bacterium]|nr:holo-ACP synthase [Bacteroidia bacterium]
MIHGVGIDVIEVERVQARVSSENGFREYVFSLHEIEYCEGKANKYEHYAARFAAKEAFLKAMGTGWSGDTAFHEIEVRQEGFVRPEIRLYGKTLETFNRLTPGKISLSLSHLKSIATAIVIIEQA